MGLECVIDIAGILGAIISIPTAIFTCINKSKLQKADARLKKELQDEDSALKTELQKADSDLKKELQEADATLKKELQEADHDFEREILLLKQQLDSIPYFNELKQKNNETIYQYMKIVEDMIANDYEDADFKDIQNRILSCVPPSLCNEIKEFNDDVTEYFRLQANDIVFSSIRRGNISDMYNNSLKEKLLSCVEQPTTTIAIGRGGSGTSVSLAARKSKSVTDSEMPKENVQGLRQEVEDFNQ